MKIFIFFLICYSNLQLFGMDKEYFKMPSAPVLKFVLFEHSFRDFVNKTNVHLELGGAVFTYRQFDLVLLDSFIRYDKALKSMLLFTMRPNLMNRIEKILLKERILFKSKVTMMREYHEKEIKKQSKLT